MVQEVGREATTGCVLEPGERLGHWIAVEEAVKISNYATYFPGFNGYIFIKYAHRWLLIQRFLVLFKTLSNLF